MRRRHARQFSLIQIWKLVSTSTIGDRHIIFVSHEKYFQIPGTRLRGYLFTQMAFLYSTLRPLQGCSSFRCDFSVIFFPSFLRFFLGTNGHQFCGVWGFTHDPSRIKFTSFLLPILFISTSTCTSSLDRQQQAPSQNGKIPRSFWAQAQLCHRCRGGDSVLVQWSSKDANLPGCLDMIWVSWVVYVSYSNKSDLKVITEDAFLDVFPEMRDPAVLGIVIGIFEIGCLIGALSCMEIGDRLGRRKTVCVGMGMLVIGISDPEDR